MKCNWKQIKILLITNEKLLRTTWNVILKTNEQ